MGAGLALHADVVVNLKLARIFSIGAYFPQDSLVFEELQRRGNNGNADIPKIFMTHCDEVVPSARSRQNQRSMSSHRLDDLFLNLDFEFIALCNAPFPGPSSCHYNPLAAKRPLNRPLNLLHPRILLRVNFPTHRLPTHPLWFSGFS